jgi:hypothetical protein
VSNFGSERENARFHSREGESAFERARLPQNNGWQKPGAVDLFKHVQHRELGAPELGRVI